MNIKSESQSRRKSVGAALSTIVLTGAVSLSTITQATAAGNLAGLVTGHILVQPQAGLPADEFDQILAPHGGKAVRRLGNLDVHVVTLPPAASEEAVADRLSRNPHIKFAEPDRLVAPGLTANDVYYGNEWHLQTMQAPAAWNLALGAGVTVAILDTGVDASHPDLQGQLVPGWNFYDNDSNTTDVYGHGTLVAGVVAANSNNATGVTSIAWNAKLMPIRISDTTGMGSWSAIASGLAWAADHDAKVANISYMVQGSSTIQSAAQYMRSKGGVVVNSAGNTGAFDVTAPSDTLVSVSATDSADTRASWSTYGAYVDLSAPGVGIWSTAAGGGYSAVSGTSFSSPLTAGVVALMMAANPALAPSQIVSILESTAVDRGDPGYDQYYGYGRVNAAAAVQAAAQSQTKDTQAPTVAIFSPTGGTVNGIVSINVNAGDNVGVTRVDLFVNGALLASDSTTPYGFSWDSTPLAGTTATLVARAYDAAGNSSDSGEAVVTITSTGTGSPDTILPTVSISNPGNGSKVTGQVNISAVSSDDVGIASLSLYVDGVMKTTGNLASMSYRWNTNKVASGTHTISAVAKDTSGNQATATIQVTK